MRNWNPFFFVLLLLFEFLLHAFSLKSKWSSAWIESFHPYSIIQPDHLVGYLPFDDSYKNNIFNNSDGTFRYDTVLILFHSLSILSSLPTKLRFSADAINGRSLYSNGDTVIVSSIPVDSTVNPMITFGGWIKVQARESDFLDPL